MTAATGVWPSDKGSRRNRFGLRRDERGAAAVEFAVVAPLLALLFAGTVDFGGALHGRFLLDSAVSAGSNYALRHADDVTAKAGAELARDIAVILAQGYRTGDIQAQVTVNNGPSAVYADGRITSAGNASNADLCYCPTAGADGVRWGSAVTCGSSCASGLTAGKFVTMSMSRPYEPIFPAFATSLLDSQIAASSVVQVQ